MNFIDLEKQQDAIRENLEKRILRVLDHGKYIMGPEVLELEERLAEFCGARHCISCANGTDALLLSLLYYGIGPGDAVFTTPFTFIATAEMIALLGATPVFVDIDERTFNISPGKLALCLKEFHDGSLPNGKPAGALKARGIIAVDLFGLPADYAALQKIASENGLFLIEDGAQSFGARCHGRRACSLGDIATTSFFPAKPLGCYGDGGAIFTDNDSVAETIGSLRIHGKGSDKYDNVRVGVNGRLDTLQAAILLEKLSVFPWELEQRQMVAGKYDEFLSSLVTVPYVPDGMVSSWAQYTVIADDRNRYQDRLRSAGIPTMIYYPTPLHLQTAFRYLEYAPGTMPASEYSSTHVFSLPMHPYLTVEEQRKIFDAMSTR